MKGDDILHLVRVFMVWVLSLLSSVVMTSLMGEDFGGDGLGWVPWVGHGVSETRFRATGSGRSERRTTCQFSSRAAASHPARSACLTSPKPRFAADHFHRIGALETAMATPTRMGGISAHRDLQPAASGVVISVGFIARGLTRRQRRAAGAAPQAERGQLCGPGTVRTLYSAPVSPAVSRRRTGLNLPPGT